MAKWLGPGFEFTGSWVQIRARHLIHMCIFSKPYGNAYLSYGVYELNDALESDIAAL